VTASVIAEGLAFGVLLAAWRVVPQVTLDYTELVRDPARYLRNTHNYSTIAVSAVVVLALATVLAAVAAVLARRINPPPSATSSWWVLFRTWRQDREMCVDCTLEDGSWFRGQLGSFNNTATETQDRDLILTAPIVYRPSPNADAGGYDVGAVCISARRIVTISVSYVPKEWAVASDAPTSEPVSAAGVEGEGASVESQARP
jgi:hypothetical protein